MEYQAENFLIELFPSRELAKQIHETLEFFSEHLRRTGMPEIRTCLAIGGIPSNAAMDVIRRGVHVMVRVLILLFLIIQ